jgi:plastocyanin
VKVPLRESLSGLALLFMAHGALATDLLLEVRDPSGKSVVDAIVYAEPATGTTAAARTMPRAVIDQVNKEFVPRVSVVQAGTEIFFPNSDNIRHSIYSFSPAKTFTTKLYSGREAAPVLFDRSGVVVLGCNIHDAMVAWIYIVDTPWFAKTGADGSGIIKGLPAGEYRISASAPALPGNLSSKAITLRVDGNAPLRQMISLQAGS